MPAARSSSKPARHLPFPTASPNRKSSQVNQDAAEVIILSSDDEQDVVNPKQNKSSRQRGKAKTRPLIPLGEVVEISSGDESQVLPNQTSTVAGLQKQLKRLQHENARFKQENTRFDRELVRTRHENALVLREIAELKIKRRPEKGELVFDASQLDDNVNCQICAMKMWTPFILPECGHSFCQSCLQDWFGTSLNQHIALHPHYSINQPPPQIPVHVRETMQNPRLMHIPHTAALIAQYNPPQPQYTCPTCRETVRNKPVEDFALKALVRTIAAAGGESSPRKELIDRKKGKGPAVGRGEPWGAFFRGSAKEK